MSQRYKNLTSTWLRKWPLQDWNLHLKTDLAIVRQINSVRNKLKLNLQEKNWTKAKLALISAFILVI